MLSDESESVEWRGLEWRVRLLPAEDEAASLSSLSKERFGERVTGRRGRGGEEGRNDERRGWPVVPGGGRGAAAGGNGDAARDEGSGTVVGSISRGASAGVLVSSEPSLRVTFFFFPPFFAGVLLGEGGVTVGSDGGEGGGTSLTVGRPTCGPRRLRIDEKCSQSWYLYQLIMTGIRILYKVCSRDVYRVPLALLFLLFRIGKGRSALSGALATDTLPPAASRFTVILA